MTEGALLHAEVCIVAALLLEGNDAGDGAVDEIAWTGISEVGQQKHFDAGVVGVDA